MKIIVRFSASILVVLIILSFSACGKRYFDTQNTSLGHKISLGMKKEDVDKLLGDPNEIYDGHFMYVNDLAIEYDYGEIDYISWKGTKWETEKNIKIGDTLEEVFEAYGEEELVDVDEIMVQNGLPPSNENSLSYHLDNNGNSCDFLSAKRNLSIYISKTSQRVNQITISKGLSMD